MRRRIHYFGGFDPRGAAWYHRLARQEAARSQPDDARVKVGPRLRTGPWCSQWTVHWHAAPDEPPAAETEFVWMGWDDVIRAHWPKSGLTLAKAAVRTYVRPRAWVTVGQAWRVHRGAFWAGLLPVAAPLLAVMLTMLLAGLAWICGPGPAWLRGLLALALGALPLLGVARLYRAVGLGWLLRIFLFTLRMGDGPLPDLAQRQQAWVDDMVARQQADPVDEVLLVGHSIGTLVMVQAVDALLRDPRWQALQRGHKTGMLTLGQSFPLVALARGAGEFCSALMRLCQSPALAWCDVTAKIDPLCFYAMHPLDGTGMLPQAQPGPHRVLAGFYRMYAPERWRSIRQNKLHTHFLYLMTPDKPGNYAFAPWCYGAMPWAQRMEQLSR